MEKKCKDHLGNKYNSIKEMCDAYGINYFLYKTRIRYGWSKKRALTEKKEITDHKGKRYKNVAEMCRAYRISIQLYNIRRENGMSKKEALETKISRIVKKGKKVEDHCGNIFPSVSDMCRHYSISKNNYFQRIKNGWTLEETLTTPIRSNRACVYVCEEVGAGVEDHKGNRFNTVEDMCNYHNVSTNHKP